MRRLQAHLQPGARPLSKRAVPQSGKAPADPYRIVDAEFLAGAGPEGTLPAPTQVEVAFAGRSNVGKSSLINSLLSRKSLVRTSSTPGSTRQVNLYQARAVDGAVFHLVDLPGYGFSHRSKAERAQWKTLIEGYLGTRVTLAAVVLLVDVRRGLEEEERDLIDFIAAATAVSRRPVEIVIVATKLDKVPRSAQKTELRRVEQAAGRPVVGFSAVDGQGRDALWRAIRRAALGEAAHTRGGDSSEGSPDAAAPGEPGDQNG